MSWALTTILICLVAWFLVAGFSQPRRVYEFPFLAGVMAFAFLLPQIPPVASDMTLPEGAYAATMGMAVLCMAMIRLGWRETAAPLPFFSQSFCEARLLKIAVAMSLIGALFYFQLSRLPSELTVGVQMSGTSVMYLFFARLLIYGLAIASLCFARRPSWLAGAVIAFDLAFCLDRILVTGKRAETLEIALILALAYWFHRGWTPPRFAVVAGVIGMTLVMGSLADYRHINRESGGFDLERVMKIDVVDNFQENLANGGLEFRNAVQRIGQIDRSGEFDYGAVHWNRLVFNFVPAQIVGASTKQALMIPTPEPARDYLPPTGTTETGLVDAFLSFWYFGAVKFLLLSYVMSRIWASAMTGSTTGQIVYMLSIVPAMHSISHVTDWVLQVWVHMLIFLAPALLLASLRQIRTPRRLAPAMAG